MTSNSKTALTAAIMACAILAANPGAASAAPAKDNGPPTIDIQKTCQESSGAFISLTGNDSQDLSTCMNDEQTAREEIVKNWASYPALAKSECIKPQEYLPGYVEWQSCLEMTRDVLNMRTQQAASATAGSDAYDQAPGRHTRSKNGSKNRECPTVQMAPDGSVSWVVNC
jgi:hypothetical protein